MRTEGIPRFEECMIWCILVELLGVVGCKGKEKEIGG